MDVIAFYAFAAIAIASSLLVVGQRNPMHSVMLLIVSFGALAGRHVLLGAPFTAVTQIIIYAGAIMVLFLFVVMLLNVPREEPGPIGGPASMIGPTGLRIGAVLSVLLTIEVVWAMWHIPGSWFSPEHAAEVSRVRNLGIAPLTRHGFRFQVAAVVLLVAMVGAVVLARRER